MPNPEMASDRGFGTGLNRAFGRIGLQEAQCSGVFLNTKPYFPKPKKNARSAFIGLAFCSLLGVSQHRSTLMDLGVLKAV